jgi:hypothetical protein
LGGGVGGVAGGAAGTAVAPVAGTAAGLILGTEGGASTGAAIGAGLGSSAGAVLGSVLCSNGAGPSFGGNSRENKQAADARHEAERRTGQRFDRNKQREFHDRITGQGLSYDELVEEAIDVLNGR